MDIKDFKKAIELAEREHEIEQRYDNKEVKLARRLLPYAAAGVFIFCGSPMAADSYKSHMNPLRDSPVVQSEKLITERLNVSKRNLEQLTASPNKITLYAEEDNRVRAALQSSQKQVLSLESELSKARGTLEYKEYSSFNSTVDSYSKFGLLLAVTASMYALVSFFTNLIVYRRKKYGELEKAIDSICSRQ